MLLFVPTPIPDELYKEIDAIQDRNWEKLQEADQKAKEAGKLVGRYIQESIADGYAIYLIIRENKETVRVRWLSDVCPGNYSVAYLGRGQATVNKKYALLSIRGRDNMEKLFGGN